MEVLRYEEHKKFCGLAKPTQNPIEDILRQELRSLVRYAIIKSQVLKWWILKGNRGRFMRYLRAIQVVWFLYQDEADLGIFSRSWITGLLSIWISVLSVAEVKSETPVPNNSRSIVDSTPGKLSELVLIRQGNLPIILSAPHGGSGGISGVSPRTGKTEGIRQFVTVRDGMTDRLAIATADAIVRKSGKQPHLVVARFSRKFVDANRPPQWAYESEAAKPVYEMYHEAIRKAQVEVNEAFGRGILIDLHGQGADRNVIFRGTRNRFSVKHLLQEWGNEAFDGKTSILGMMAERGHTLFPECGKPDREHPSFNGGYITGTYGSGQKGTIDAIQMEFGYNSRSQANLKKTADDLAEALLEFTRSYLTAKPAESASGS